MAGVGKGERGQILFRHPTAVRGFLVRIPAADKEDGGAGIVAVGQNPYAAQHDNIETILPTNRLVDRQRLPPPFVKAGSLNRREEPSIRSEGEENAGRSRRGNHEEV